MDDIENMHIVEFDMYCPTCKYKKTKETDDPCNLCLTITVRENSRKPEKWEEPE